MDSLCKINLHPNARMFLFEHYFLVNQLFKKTLNQVNANYFSIALVDKEARLLLLSSHPSVDHNLLEKNLWQLDEKHHANVAYHNQHTLRHEITAPATPTMEGLFVSTESGNYRVIFSFGFNALPRSIKSDNIKYSEQLLETGKAALDQLRCHITFPD